MDRSASPPYPPRVNDQPNHPPPSPAGFSGLAAIAFILAILSIAACAIPFAAASISASLTYAVFAMPVIGLAAACFAFLSTRQIARSNGMIAGKPLALIAMFVGLAVAILQGAFVIGAVRTVAGIRNTLVPVVHEFVSETAQGDDAAARALLAPAVANNLPPAAIIEFNNQLTAQIGTFSKAELNFTDVLAASAALRARAIPGAQIPAFDARPVVLLGASGRATAYAFLDETAIEKNTILFVDMLVVLPESDRAITLQPTGPASKVAAALSLSTTGSP